MLIINVNDWVGHPVTYLVIGAHCRAGRLRNLKHELSEQMVIRSLCCCLLPPFLYDTPDRNLLYKAGAVVRACGKMLSRQTTDLALIGELDYSCDQESLRLGSTVAAESGWVG